MTSIQDSEQPLFSILSDQPANKDQLNFAPYVETLADIVSDPRTDTPLTIGIFGEWGRGKTSLMRMVQQRLLETSDPGFPVRAAWFNAWLYSHQQSLHRALISRVLAAAHEFPTIVGSEHAHLAQMEARLYGVAPDSGGQLHLPPTAFTGLQGASLPPLMALELLRRQAERLKKKEELKSLADLIADVKSVEFQTCRDQIAAMDDFRRCFEEISRKCIVDHGRLVVLIDDLDRCLPDQAVEVLEAIKLFLDVPGCVFILGVAREVLEEGIRVRYADYETKLDSAQYLEKIIQIPFALPPIPAESINSYVQEATHQRLPDQQHCEKVFAVGLEPNPRRIKRTLNIFFLLWRLSQKREELRERIKPARLAKIVIIQQYYPNLFQLIVKGPHYLVDLERRFREQGQGPSGPMERETAVDGSVHSTTEEDLVSAGPLASFLGNSLLRALLTCTGDDAHTNFADIGPAGVREYIYLTRSTVEEIRTATEVPMPFESQMVTIPEGSFWMGTTEAEVPAIEQLGLERQYVEREVDQHLIELPAFAIGRYPVTNAEFTRFIEDGGYEKKEYWTAVGWKRKERERWTQPRYWEDQEWNDPAQPVVGVSWYEALAYCRWLSDKTGQTYRLPTEAEWEKAARGDDGRRYPWGDRWEAGYCNNKESGLGRTMPVGQHPDGDSPYGVGDMVGQVWEWCSSKYSETETGKEYGYPYRKDDKREELEEEAMRVLRGGSWYDEEPAAVCRCSCRGRRNAGDRNSSRGFRCVRVLA